MLATEFPEVLPAEAAPAPWECQRHENTKQFWYFSEYRNLHPLRRSLVEVGRSSGVSVSFLERLSTQHHWVDRAAAWDQECDLQTRVRLSDQLEQMQRRHLQIADVALAKISKRLDDLDAKDIQVQHIPKLLSAIIEIQQMVFPPPAETRQPGQVMTATEIRLLLRAEESLSTREHEPQPSVSPRLKAWVRGDLDTYDREHE